MEQHSNLIITSNPTHCTNTHTYTALYCRLSLDDGNEGDSNSIINQKKMLEDYAERKGYTPYKIFVDDGYSGTNFAGVR